MKDIEIYVGVYPYKPGGYCLIVNSYGFKFYHTLILDGQPYSKRIPKLFKIYDRKEKRGKDAYN